MMIQLAFSGKVQAYTDSQSKVLETWQGEKELYYEDSVPSFKMNYNVFGEGICPLNDK